MAGNFFLGSKAQVRVALEARRRALSAAEVKAKGGEAQRALAALSSFQEARKVALYGAQSFEVPTGLLWEGKQVCLPKVVKGSRVLAFHAVKSPEDMVLRGKLLLPEPPDDAPEVELEEIDFWVVPGVGFTARGDRLGRGAGYYDATLARARPGVPSFGLAFECCLVPSLPTEAHDVRLDGVVTERGLARG